MPNENKVHVPITADDSDLQAAFARSGKTIDNFHNNVLTSTKKFAADFQKHWVGIAAAAGTAMYAAKKAWDTASMAAEFLQERAALENLAASYGKSSSQIINDLKQVSAQTIDTRTIIEKAGTAMLLGIPADRLTKLMEIARASSRVTGNSISESFSDISLAVGRQSRMILDNLGIIVKVEDANKKYAASLGKVATELTEAERKEAFLNATMIAGEDIIRRVGLETNTINEDMQAFEATVKDLQLSMGILTIRGGAGVIGMFDMVAAGALNTASYLWKLIEGLTYLQLKTKEFLRADKDEINALKRTYEETKKVGDNLAGAAGELANKAVRKFEVMTASLDKLAAASGKVSISNIIPDTTVSDTKDKLASLKEEYIKFVNDIEIAQQKGIDRELKEVDVWASENIKKFQKITGAREIIEQEAARRRVEIEVNASNDIALATIKSEQDSLKRRISLENDMAQYVAPTIDNIKTKYDLEKQSLQLSIQELDVKYLQATEEADKNSILKEQEAIRKEILNIDIKSAYEVDMDRIKGQIELNDLLQQEKDFRNSIRNDIIESALDMGDQSGDVGAGINDSLNNVSSMANSEDETQKQMDQLNDMFIKKLEISGKFNDLEIENLRSKKGLELEIELEAAAQLADMDEALAKKREDAENLSWKRKTKMVQSSFGAMAGIAQAFYALSNNQNEKAFKAYQAFAIGEALISTYAGAARALKDYSFPYSLAVAALVTAQGMARINAIASQRPGDSTSSTESGSTGAIGTETPTISESSVLEVEKQPSASYQIYIYGNVYDQDRLARELVPALEKARRDGAR
jgi:hypothetical protein